MSAQEASVVQWVICGLIFWFVVGWIILIFEIHRAPAEKPEPYNVVNEAERVLYAYQKTEATE